MIDKKDHDLNDPFARVASAARSASPKARPAIGGELVCPVPPSAPAPSFLHPRAGSPTAAPWAYRNHQGEVLFYACRFDKSDGGKDVLPYSLWRTEAGRLEWRWKGLAEPRPMYGLDRLGEPGSPIPVLVVEGEKTADAAVRLFPDHCVVTWPGGAKAVGKVDWTPLSGRLVVIMPDADAVGKEAAQRIAQAARAAGAVTAAVVSLPVGLPEGWDLADPMPANFSASDATAAIAAALAATTVAAILPRGFKLDAGGLYWAPEGDGTGEAKPPTWLCGKFDVVALARDEDGLDWSLVIEFRDLDGHLKREIIGRSELAGDGVDVRRRLMGGGLPMASGRFARERLAAALSTIATTSRVRLASATGWKNGVYVLPHRTIGAGVAEPVIFRGRAGATHHGERGSYSVWRDLVADPMNGNALGVFAVSCAFAAPLLRTLNAEGGGFHLRGGSSSGKTTILEAAGSVWGGGGPLGYCQSWRNTDNALEGVAVAHNDCLIALDELRSLEPDAAGKAAYSLATGITKGRMTSASELRARPSWRVLILSTGELSLSDLIRLSRGKDKTYAGQELRLIDVAVDMGRGWGAWEQLHGYEAPAKLSDGIKRACEANYGFAGPLFVERFLQRRTEMEAAAESLRASFLEAVLESDDIGQASRGAQRFAMAAVGGELAAMLDVVPWRPGEAASAAATMFRRWASTFGRKTQHEDQEAQLRVKAFLERFEYSRFRWLRDDLSYEEQLAAEASEQDGKPDKLREGEARSLDMAGWKATHSERGLLFHFNPEFWRTELFAGMDATAAARALKAKGFLISNGGEGRLTNKVATPSGKRNFYTVSAAILQGERDDEA